MKKTYLPAPLPESEWDFSRYKSEFEITQAFYYEYSRSCEAIHPIILGGRHFWGSSVHVPEEIKLSDPEAYFEAVKSLPGGLYFEFLSAMPEFPKKPLCDCEDLGIKFQFYGQHTSPAALKSYEKAFFEPDEPRLKGLNEISPDCYSDPFIIKSGYGMHVISFLGLNWGCTDKELLEDFERLLKSNRPKQFEGLRHPLQRGLGNRVLPFRKDAALGWLEVWRKKEKGTISWDQYISLYHPDHDHPNRPKYSKKESKITTLKAMNAKAKKVIRWFAGEDVSF